MAAHAFGGYMTVHEFTIKEVELINFKKRRYVRRLAQRALDRGELVRPKTCELCLSEGKMEAHHVDYGKPLAVTWLCKKCHCKAHTDTHPLNPDNNPQSPMPYLVEEYQKITVTFELPIRNYLALKEQSEKTGKPIGSIMREKAESAFPVQDPQLKFKLEDQQDDESQNVAHERVQSVEKNEGLRQQPQRTVLQEIRRPRNYNMQGMEQQLFAVPSGYGTDARRLQRSVACR